jgi:hypothetical protein
MWLLFAKLPLAFCRRAAVLMRGKRAESRAAIGVLLGYLVGFVALAVSAILFWALAKKAAVAPLQLALPDVLRETAGQMIPGVATPGPLFKYPFWIQIGPGLTAWLLFVVYLAPAANLLPGQQIAFRIRMRDTYKRLRFSSVAMKRYTSMLRLWEAKHLRDNRFTEEDGTDEIKAE